MKINIVSFLLCLLTINGFAQDTKLMEYVKRGIILHDEGKYDQAIKEYKKALKIDKKSALVHYEIAYAYNELGDKKAALKHVNKALKGKGSEELPMLYVMKGNFLDDAGEAKQAIKVYEEGLRRFPNFYMLYFNMGITYSRMDMPDNAKNAFINAISNEFGYPSSHYYLGELMEMQGRKIPAIMSYYFFLMLEPETIRADGIYDRLMNLLFKSESEKGNKKIEINLGDSDMSDLEFAPMELLLHLDVAKESEEETPKTDTEKLIAKTRLLFSTMKEKKETNKGIWWDFYAPFYAKMFDCEVITTFCYHIGQSKGGNIALWLEGHEEEVTEFVECVNKE